MATTERAALGVDRTRVAVFVLGGLLVAGVVAVAMMFFNRPPQMGTDEAVFNTVDALYTAVRSKDEARMAQCEQRLHAYREAGKLPEESAAYLDGVIAKARSGEWQSATERLYNFMLAQRREGAIEHHEKKTEPRKSQRK